MSLHADHHQHHLFLDMLHNPLTKIYLLQAVMTFVKSLLGIFIPVYLYSLGFSLTSIGLYLALISISALFFMSFSVKIIVTLGYKYTILLSLPMYVLHISLFYFLSSEFIIYLAAIIFGMYISFFWPAYHMQLAQSGSDRHRAKELGTLQVIITLVSSLSPFIGGIFLDFLSYLDLLVFSLSILFIGFIPFLFSKEIPLKKFKFSLKDYFLVSKELKSNEIIVFLGSGIEFVVAVYFWPIFIFILVGNSFTYLGLLFTVVSLLTVIFITFFKSYVDSHSKPQLLKISTKLMSVNWVLRGFFLVFFIPLIYLSEAIQKIVISSYHLCFNSLFYNNAKHSKDQFGYVMGHDILTHISRIILSLSIAFLAFFISSTSIIFGIIILIGVIVPFALSKFR